jgi:hypothetical protein
LTLGLTQEIECEFLQDKPATGAAWCFVEALKANPFNLKAAERLRQLLIDYPTLPMEEPPDSAGA